MKYKLNIAWLYPDLMSTYGDRGNIITLQKRSEWRGINTEVLDVTIATPKEILAKADIIFMGGAQDTQQEIVNEDLIKNKGRILIDKVKAGTPGLFICGAYQFLGKYYKTASGNKIPGLGLFPLYTENPGENVSRLIGNIIVETSSLWQIADSKSAISHTPPAIRQIVGFENHGGRTYLENKEDAFARVLKGHGNNGDLPAMQDGKALQAGDDTEGIRYKNAIGTYLHGPILPKNPQIADDLIKKAIELKYKEKVQLEKLDDSLEEKARQSIIDRILS